jgi:hypothetical protein
MKYSYELIVLCILVFIAFKMFGVIALIAAAFASIIYLYWFSAPSSTPIDVDKFIDADPEMKNAIAKLEKDTEAVPFDYKQLLKNINEFIQLYIYCFVDSDAVRDQFSNLVYQRRLVLNHIATLKLDTDPMANVTYKYIKALDLKYNLDFDYPLAANEQGRWDLF